MTIGFNLRKEKIVQELPNRHGLFGYGAEFFLNLSKMFFNIFIEHVNTGNFRLPEH